MWILKNRFYHPLWQIKGDVFVFNSLYLVKLQILLVSFDFGHVSQHMERFPVNHISNSHFKRNIHNLPIMSTKSVPSCTIEADGDSNLSWPAHLPWNDTCVPEPASHYCSGHRASIQTASLNLTLQADSKEEAIRAELILYYFTTKILRIGNSTF